MAEIRVLEGQSLFDLAIQTAGSMEASFLLAESNKIGIADDIAPGATLVLSETVNKDIADYYNSRNLQPATNATIEESKLTGIGNMIVEQNFIIQ